MADKKLPAENKKDKKNKRSLTVKKLPGIFKKSYTEKNFEDADETIIDKPTHWCKIPCLKN